MGEKAVEDDEHNVCVCAHVWLGTGVYVCMYGCVCQPLCMCVCVCVCVCCV